MRRKGFRYVEMNVDDNWDILNISDHNLITIKIDIDKNKIKYGNETEEIEFYKINEVTVKRYLDTLKI